MGRWGAGVVYESCPAADVPGGAAWYPDRSSGGLLQVEYSRGLPPGDPEDRWPAVLGAAWRRDTDLTQPEDDPARVTYYRLVPCTDGGTG